jgi:hypothetical protein
MGQEKEVEVMRVLILVMAIILIAGPALANTGVVEEVIDGGTIRFGESFVARLTGLAVPDTMTSIGRMICSFTRQEVEGKLVRLFTWTKDNTAAGIVHDENNLPFVQIFYKEEMSTSFNEVLLKKGYARVVKKYLPDDLEHYLDLEREARIQELGIWAGKGR